MDHYAVIGNPVAHSRSPVIHRLFAMATAQEMTYGALLAPREGFAQTLRAFVGRGGRGANVTLPFKEEAAAIVDRLDPSAGLAGAVNTVVVAADGSLAGFNTDGIGLIADLQSGLGVQLAGARILMLGAGGAARGAIGPLLGAQCAQLALCNRTPARAAAVAAVFADRRVTVIDGSDVREPFDLIINATSASLTGATVALPPRAIGETSTFYDMVYGDAARASLETALSLGAKVVSDGLGMLVEQAAAAFALWRGVRPDTRTVIAELRAQTEESAL